VCGRFHVLLLHTVFLRDLLSDVMESFHIRFDFGRGGVAGFQKLDDLAGETLILLDSRNVALDKKPHIAEGFLHVILFCEFLPGFEDGLNGFRASAGASAMDTVSAPAMMRAEFPTG